MAVWQYQPDSGVGWYTIRFDIAATVYVHLGMKVRLTTDHATLRDCWHCGRVMEAGKVDEKGREWCGCMQVEKKRMIAEMFRHKENERSLT